MRSSVMRIAEIGQSQVGLQLQLRPKCLSGAIGVCAQVFCAARCLAGFVVLHHLETTRGSSRPPDLARRDRAEGSLRKFGEPSHAEIFTHLVGVMICKST